MNKLTFKPVLSVLDNYDVFLFDLWGVIYEENYVYEGVVEIINQILKLKKVYFVSNAPRPAAASHKTIQSWGINVQLEQVFTSGELARKMINDNKEESKKQIIYHLGRDRNDDILSGLAIAQTDDILEANTLLITLYRDQGEDLAAFDEFFKKAASLNLVNICANPDTIIPKNGISRYCSGYFAAKLEALGQKIIYTGKPYIEIYNQILQQLPAVPKGRILMIGDTHETDIMGANNIGIDSALVMTGNAQKYHLDYPALEDKLTSLYEISKAKDILPTFVTSLS